MRDASRVERHKSARPLTVPSKKMLGLHEAIAGASAGLLTIAIFHPIDTIKTILQSSAGARGTRGVTYGLIARGGIQALYRGAGPALLGNTASWAAYMQAFYALRGDGNQSVAVDMAAAAAAGGITAAITNPIWMVKTRMQLVSRTAAATNTVTGVPTVTLIQKMLKEEGVATFYRGLVPSLWLVSNAAIQFALYERIKLILGTDSVEGPTASQTAIASSVSKLVSTSITYPLQVVRTRLQEPGARQKGYNSFPGTMRLVALQDGIPAFYRGLMANLIRVIPQSTVTLVIFETVLKVVR